MCTGQDPLIIILKIVKNKNKKLMALETCMRERLSNYPIFYSFLLDMYFANKNYVQIKKK